ncbi:hypothetical protein PHYC_03698 [Phycisphaerales bacterium]|nr:hypothetical protein PHYC_03698 [Phycisphaerales bacterium]
MRRSIAAVLCLSGLSGAPASADVIRLKSGDVLIAEIVSRDDLTLTLKHPVLGVIAIPVERVQGADEEPTAADQKPAAPREEPTSMRQGWTGSIDLGVNGSSGNSDTSNARIGVGAKRSTPWNVTTAGLLCSHAASDGAPAVTRAAATARHEWLFPNRPWGVFVLGGAEYDDSQDWDCRLSGFAGPSYRVVRTEHTEVKTRLGMGGSREFGGGRNEIVPEGLLGVDFEHRFDDRSRCFSTVELIPSLTEIPNYRVNAKAGYEILLDPKSKMNLKIGVEDRYNSDPGDSQRNSLEYFVTLGWNF